MNISNRYRYLLSAAAFSVVLSMSAAAGQWQQGKGEESGKWWYNNLDGTCPKGEWVWIDGDWDGYAECYYFDEDGWLVTSQTIEGEQVDGSGAWIIDGVVQLKSSTESGVATNGLNEVSTGVVELGSDLELGTEWHSEAEDTEKGTVIEVGEDVYTGISDAVQEGAVDTEVKEGEEDVYHGPGTGDVSVISVSAGPEAVSSSDKTAAVTTTSSKTTKTTGTAEAYSGNVGSSADDLPRSEATELVNYARSFIGVLPYVTAGASLETGADCSGFTQQIFKHFGITIPRDSRSQYAAAEKISVEDLQAGDLIFYGSSPSTIYHVGIYAGNGRIVHCTHSGDYVREHNVFYAKPYGYGRFS